MTNVKGDLVNIKSKLDSIETKLVNQMNELQIREEKWKKLDEQVYDIVTNHDDIVKFNVGGKKFATKKSTLLKIKDTLFYKIVSSDKIDLKNEVFLDRSPKFFAIFLDYLRYGTINYTRYNFRELEEMKLEALYYELFEISDVLEQQLQQIEYVNMETSGNYVYNGQTAGTNKIEDLTDGILTTGVCANSPGMITIELNKEWEIEEIEMGGYTGNSAVWYSGNGVGAQISTSIDKETWKNVGVVPNTYATTIVKVNVTKTVAKYIRISHNNFLGFGHFKVIKKEN